MGVYGVEGREGVSVSVMGSIMEDTIGKEMGEDWVYSEPIVGVSRVVALAGREEVTILCPVSGGLLLRESPRQCWRGT
jgi:hypothetical protein